MRVSHNGVMMEEIAQAATRWMTGTAINRCKRTCVLCTLCSTSLSWSLFWLWSAGTQQSLQPANCLALQKQQTPQIAKSFTLDGHAGHSVLTVTATNRNHWGTIQLKPELNMQNKLHMIDQGLFDGQLIIVKRASLRCVLRLSCIVSVLWPDLQGPKGFGQITVVTTVDSSVPAGVVHVD